MWKEGKKAMNIYIYVDDIRSDDRFFKSLKGEWCPVICRSYEETVSILEYGISAEDTVLIDLDHDLGFDDEDGSEQNGYDICKYIVEHQIPIAAFHIHSMNPVGCTNMRQLLTHYGVKEI